MAEDKFKHISFPLPDDLPTNKMLLKAMMEGMSVGVLAELIGESRESTWRRLRDARRDEIRKGKHYTYLFPDDK